MARYESDHCKLNFFSARHEQNLLNLKNVTSSLVRPSASPSIFEKLPIVFKNALATQSIAIFSSSKFRMEKFHTFLESLCVIEIELVLETVVVQRFEKPEPEGGALVIADELEGSADAFLHSERGV
jgi:hypothetical protein